MENDELHITLAPNQARMLGRFLVERTDDLFNVVLADTQTQDRIVAIIGGKHFWIFENGMCESFTPGR